MCDGIENNHSIFVLGFLKEAPTYRNKMLIPRPGLWTNLHVLQKK
jgi:hypothetical protein